MTDSSLELDDAPEPKKKKHPNETPVWAVILVILAFGCFTATLVFQYLEFAYYRGGAPSETDPYAERVVLPPAS